MPQELTIALVLTETVIAIVKVKRYKRQIEILVAAARDRIKMTTKEQCLGSCS